MTEREVAAALVKWSLNRNPRRPGHPTQVLRMGLDPEAHDEILISLEDNGREVQRFRCAIEELGP